MRVAAALLLLAMLAIAPSASAAGTGGAGVSDSTAAAGSSGGSSGGASGDSADGGPLDAGALPFGAPVRQQPVARVFRTAPRTIREGGRVRLKIRVDEPGVDTVSARIVAIHTRTKAVGASFSLGTIRTGRLLTRRWPAKAVPKRGRYLVRLHVKDPQGAVLARAQSATGKSRLVVKRRPRHRPRPENTRPEPQPEPTPTPPPAQPEPPAPQAGGVFPVAGSHTFGGEGSKFGAGRPGHIHEGQDIAAAEGTPVVAPVAGLVKFVKNQPSAAGWYVVLDADDGTSMFFAHLQAGSIAVTEGQRVAPGQALARVGTTGSSTGPHLHFEIWQGGWRDRGGKPIDPLPQLLAWSR